MNESLRAEFEKALTERGFKGLFNRHNDGKGAYIANSLEQVFDGFCIGRESAKKQKAPLKGLPTRK